MIRLTVEQLYALQKSIQSGGQVNATVLPMNAMSTHRLVVAWAKGRSAGEHLYLSLWRNQRSWEEAREQDRQGVDAPYDYINDDHSMEYTHTYPVGGTVTVPGLEQVYRGSAADSGHPEFGVTYGK